MADSDENKQVPVLSKTVSSTEDSNMTKSSDIDHDYTKMAYLTKALGKTVDKCLSSVKLSSFARCHPEEYKKNPKVFQAVHEEYKERLNTAINTEIDVMMSEENLEQIFTDLKATCASAETRDGSRWRPSGDPQRDVCAHMMPLKLKQKQKMQALLNELQAENRRLESQVRQRRKLLVSTQQRTSEKQSSMRQCIQNIPTREIADYLTSTVSEARRTLPDCTNGSQQVG